MKTTPEEFLRRHDMYYDQMPFEELVRLYREEMDAGLAGRPSSLYMLPSYIRSDAEPLRGESVLVLDAGGTNFRAGRAHFDEHGLPVIDALKKRRMPGALGDAMDADTMFRRMAEFALEMAEGCRYACISFSYPCRIRPDGDGEILALAKEVEVTGAEGRPVCACLEAALVALGAKGERKWRLVNDSVGSLLGGMATADRSLFDDYIGFILGTGVNSCCRLPAAWITKDPQAAAMGGETVVNMESGCFGRLLFGTADRLLDERSEMPGDHPAEKMISGSYFRQLLTLTLELAAREGEIPGEFTKNIGEYRISSANVDAFYLDPHGDNPLAAAISDREAQDFAAGVNDALLERAARVAAAGLCAVIESRSLPRGSRVCICADGSMIRLSPALRPKMEAYLRAFALEKLGVETQFRFADDATLLGCAWAGLIG